MEEKTGKSLNKRPELSADVIIQIDEASTTLENCIIYANDKDDKDIVFIAQDSLNPNRKIQVTVRKNG